MKIQLRLLLIFISLNIYSNATVPNEIIGTYDSLNPLSLPNPPFSLATPVDQWNFLQVLEYLSQAPSPSSSVVLNQDTGVVGTGGFYTLFFTFIAIEPVDDYGKLGFTLNVYCGTAAGGVEIIAPIIQSDTHSDTLSQKVDLTVVRSGSYSKMRSDYFSTITIPETGTGTCSSPNTITITITLTGYDPSHIFHIKRLALFSLKCHPTCLTCDPATPRECVSCPTGFPSPDASGYCNCERNAPFLGLVPAVPNFKCEQLIPTGDLPCTSWISINDAKYKFDYCLSCGGKSQVVQSLKMPYSYSGNNAAYTDPAICACPYGTYSVTSGSQKVCKTVQATDCTSTLSTEMTMLAVSSYLANISENLSVTITKDDVQSVVLLTFKVTNNMSDPHLLSYRVYYTLINYNEVEIDVPQDGSEHTIQIPRNNLSTIKDCTSQGTAPNILTKCTVQLVAYSPCTDLIYMRAYIFVEIGDDILKKSEVIGPGAPQELDYPCLLNDQCYINKVYTVSIALYADSGCTISKGSSDFSVGDTIWVKSTLSPDHTHDLQYAFFAVYTSAGRLVGSIDLSTKYTAGATNIYGFPVELPGDVLESDELSSGQMKLTLTFRITSSRLRMLEDPHALTITPPVSISIHIADKHRNPIATTAVIDICTLIGAAIVSVIVYCLLKMKKIEEVKKPVQPDVKVSSTINTGNTNLCSEREPQLKEENQRI